MRAARWLPIALWAAGGALIVDSVVRGSAQVWLVVVIPVVSGESAEFLLGVVLLLAGFLTFPWLGRAAEGPEGSRGLPTSEPPVSEPPWPRGDAPSGTGGGGLILIGPVPIFFGGWRHASRRTRWLAVAGGAILFLALFLWAVL